MLPSRPSSKNNCCEPPVPEAHPDHTELLPRLNRAQGQLNGIQKMITDGRYCVDILTQLRAASAALRSIEAEIFEKHLRHCLVAAFRSRNEKQVAEKIAELTELLQKRNP